MLDPIRKRALFKRAQEKALALDHGAHVVLVLQKMRRDQGHGIGIGGSQPHLTA